MADQENINLEFQRQLGDFSKTLGVIEERTRVLPDMVAKVDQHDKDIAFARGGIKILGIIYTFLITAVGWLFRRHQL